MEQHSPRLGVAAYGQEMEIRVLGPVGVWVDGESLPVGGTKQRSALAVLAAYAGEPVSVGQLIEAVYGDDASDGAKRTIHTYVSNLRREVRDAITGSGEAYQLDPDLVDIDARRFEQLFLDGSGLVESSPHGAATMLREALALWHGRPYVDVETHGLLEPEVVRLEEQRLAALEARIEAELASGLHRELLGELEALTEEHPLRERLRAQHMLALYRSGRQSEALRAFSRTRDLLVEEMGITPSPQLQKLEEQILMQDPALDVPGQVAIERRAVLAAEMDDRLRYAPTSELDAALRRRNDLLEHATAAAGGAMLDLRGTAVYAAFESVGDAVDVARSLADISTQIAIDFGDVELRDDGGLGPPVTLALRLAAVGHAGQVLISEDAQAKLATEGRTGWSVAALGDQAIRGVGRPVAVFQLAGDGLGSDFPELRLDRLPPPLPAAYPGSVPGYELREELGGGVTGVVHRAYQSAVGREVAVRAIRPELVDDPRFIRRFEAEAQRLAAIEHPHVVPLLDYWRDPAHAYIVHRLVQGRPISTASAAALEGDIVGWLAQIASGLAAGHTRGVAHGRIRPDNVLIDEGGYAYLADLGVAAMFEGMVTATADAYTAPEAIGGSVSVAGDVYGLGVLALEMLAGEPVPLDGVLPTVGSRVDGVIARATHDAPDRRYASVVELVDALAAAIDGGSAAVAAVLPLRELRNPFKGLAAFQESDAVDFHGRDDLVAALRRSVAERPFTLVAGPSGIGKSSVVRAGLIPAMRDSDGILVTDMYPGARPFDSLEAALDRVAVRPLVGEVETLRSGNGNLSDVIGELVPEGARLLLVVDQFEELFTHTIDEATRRRFLDILSELGAVAEPLVRVVATIRADFLDRPLRYADFGQLVGASTVTVSAPTTVELGEIVTGPATAVGLEVDEALVEALVADADEQPGALPLLQHTLTEMFTQRDSDRLQLDDYRSSGGLTGAIGRRAGSIYQGLAEEDHATVREVFLRLVTVDEESDTTRRRVRRSELEHMDVPRDSLDRVLDAFGRHRLLVFDRDATTRAPTVEVAHEALISEWERLRNWIDDTRDDLLTARRLETGAAAWEAAERDPSYLLRGGQLDRAHSWRAESGLQPSALVSEFVEAGLAREAAETADRRKWRRLILGGFAAAAVVALVLAVVAWVQRGSAEREAQLATAQRLVLQSERSLATDPELSIMLGVQAIEVFRRYGDVPESAVTTLRQGIANQRVVARWPGGGAISVNDAGTLLVTTTDGGALPVWDIDSLEQTYTISGTDGLVALEAWFLADSELIVLLGDVDTGHGRFRLYDLDTGTWDSLFAIDVPLDADWWFDNEPGGGLFALWIDQRLQVFDRQSMLYEEKGLPEVAGLVLSDDSRLGYAVLGPETAEIRIVDARTGDRLQTIVGISGNPILATFSPDNTRLAYSDDESTMSVVDLSTGEELWFRDNLISPFWPIWLPDGNRIVTGREGALQVLDASTGATIGLIAGRPGETFGAVTVPGTSLLATAGHPDADLLLIDVSPSGRPELEGELESRLQQPISSRVSPDGRAIFFHDPGQFEVIDTETGETLLNFETPEDPGYPNAAGFAVASRNGAYVAGFDNESFKVWSMADGTRVYTAPVGWSIRAVNGDASLVVITKDFEATKLIRTQNGSEVATLDAGPVLIKAFFSADGAYVVTNAFGRDPEFQIWETATGSYVNDLGEYVGLKVDFTNEGDRLILGAANDEDGTVVVFDFAALRNGVAAQDALMEPTIEAHANTIVSLRISPDDSMLATGTFDGPDKLWDLGTGDLLGEFGGPGRTVMAFDSARPRLWVSDSGRVTAHTLDLDELIEIAHSRLSREMTEDECQLYLRRGCSD